MDLIVWEHLHYHMNLPGVWRPIRWRIFLLRCIRGYLETTMYTSLELQTALTIAAGRKALDRFGAVMEVSYSAAQSQQMIETFLGIH